MRETERGAWAIWHPTKGFGHYINVNTEIDDAKADLDARCILEDDDLWKIVPVRVYRVDHT